ncbi:MAG TPA: hypothetical protein EYN96_12610 [Candidatus Hydrogenedentes bacterium]|nr:hypothetical protein [Candidatus Hydrogenedentota bacterium]
MWVGRLVVPVITGWLGWQLVQWQPGLFFPNHDLGIYGEVLGRNLDRTVYTNTQNFRLRLDLLVLSGWRRFSGTR